MKNTLAMLVLCSYISAAAQPHDLQPVYAQAREAYKAGDYTLYYKKIQEAYKIHPYHQGVLYHFGIASALNNKPGEAVQFLSQAIQINAEYDLTSNDFNSLRDRDDFKTLLVLQKELQRQMIHSDTAFVIHEKTLHVECIATGESKNVFYLGSIHKRKIVRVENGTTKDFTSTAQDGLASVFGIKVDPKKKILWACSSPLPEMENYDTLSSSGVFKYDLQTGKLIQKYIPEGKRKFIFGDLTLDNSGKVFISDSRNNIIFTINESTGKLEEYFTSSELWNLQGLTFSKDNRYLFIADYIKGIFRLDTKDKTLKKLDQKFHASVKAIDGLTFYNNSLIAIQNSIYPMRVTMYKLNSTMDELSSFIIIDRAHPAFNEPTIGCLQNETFYYVANSLWSGYTEHHELKKEDQLQEVVILKTDLKKLK